MGINNNLTFDELTTLYNMCVRVINRAVKPQSRKENVFIPHQFIIQLFEFLEAEDIGNTISKMTASG